MPTKQIKFLKIDVFNRPIFKQVDAKLYYGSTHRLFPIGTTEREVLKTVKEEDICYFGERFNCEPMGSNAGNIEIVTNHPIHNGSGVVRCANCGHVIC